MKYPRPSKRNSRKARGVFILCLGLLTLVLTLVYGFVPGANSTSSLGVVLLISVATFGVLALAHSMDLGIGLATWLFKYARSVAKRSFTGSKAQLKELERDYIWRRIKVAYAVISILTVVLAFGVAYNSTVYETRWGTMTEPSMDRGYAALSISAVLAWLIYWFLLPRAYTYLKKPSIINP